MTKQDKLCVQKIEATLQEKFAKCPIDKRPALFKKLEEWANKDLAERVRGLFLKALYECSATHEAQLCISLDNALNAMLRGK